MGNKKLTWAIVTTIAAGLAVYLVMIRKKAYEGNKPYKPGEKYLTDVFAKAKNYGGGEFVL